MTTAARRSRVPGSRSDRLFAKAERLAAAWRFAEAERAFDEAIAHDPTYAHLYLYKALTVAELDRYGDALRLIDQGVGLSPRSAVFPMQAGCMHLDEGRRDAAAASFAQASALAPDNRLIASYALLTTAMAGDRDARATLAGTTAMAPDGFKARLLVALGASAGAGTPPSEGSAIHRLRVSRLKRRVRRLIARERFEAAVELLQSSGVRHDAELRSIEASATAAAIRQAEPELREADRSSAGEPRRRDLLLRLANLRVAEPDAQYRDLDAWRKSIAASGRPTGESMLMPQVLAAMADAEYRSGHPEAALALCEQSRAAGSIPEADWVEAQAQRDAGRRRLARRLFERFARAEPLMFSERVEAVL